MLDDKKKYISKSLRTARVAQNRVDRQEPSNLLGWFGGVDAIRMTDGSVAVDIPYEIETLVECKTDEVKISRFYFENNLTTQLQEH